MTDPFVGSLTFVRIYSGMLKTGTGVLNSVKDKRERIGRMLLMHANNREEIKEARAGDIVALVGLKNTHTGDTLCDPDKPIVLERMEFPEPVIEVAVEPKTKADQEKMGEALAAARDRGPVLPRLDRSRERPDDHQGHGRAPPRDHRRPHEARVQGRGQRRRAAGRLPRDDHRRRPSTTTRTRSRPAAPASTRASSCASSRWRPAAGFEFENDVVGGSVPKEYMPGVEKGLEARATPACSPASR